MTTQSIKVGTQSIINVTLKEDSQVLAETVVIGYGSAKKRDLTGSITNVKGEEIANKPAMNPLSSLQGKSGRCANCKLRTSRSRSEIRIRGTNSINGYKPLYIVDGLFNDNINFLNPEDIESMEILKDPSSLAIFGVRGANGVIIITTKKAKEGQTLVNINTSFGFKKVVDKVKLVNGPQFKELYSEQLANQKDDPFDSPAGTPTPIGRMKFSRLPLSRTIISVSQELLPNIVSIWVSATLTNKATSNMRNSAR